MGTNSKLNNKPQDNGGEVDDFTAILHHKERFTSSSHRAKYP